jgi:hypothetical protein
VIQANCGSHQQCGLFPHRTVVGLKLIEALRSIATVHASIEAEFVGDGVMIVVLEIVGF